MKRQVLKIIKKKEKASFVKWIKIPSFKHILSVTVIFCPKTHAKKVQSRTEGWRKIIYANNCNREIPGGTIPVLHKMDFKIITVT